MAKIICFKYSVEDQKKRIESLVIKQQSVLTNTKKYQNYVSDLSLPPFPPFLTTVCLFTN